MTKPSNDEMDDQADVIPGSYYDKTQPHGTSTWLLGALLLLLLLLGLYVR